MVTDLYIVAQFRSRLMFVTSTMIASPSLSMLYPPKDSQSLGSPKTTISVAFGSLAASRSISTLSIGASTVWLSAPSEGEEGFRSGA